MGTLSNRDRGLVMRRLAVLGAVVVVFAFLSLLTAGAIVAYARDSASTQRVDQAPAEELSSSTKGQSGKGIVLVMVAVVAAGIVLWREQTPLP